MAKTGSNRGWGAAASEQVDPDANPDFKQVFDCGLTLPAGDPLLDNPFYAPNHWPDQPEAFQAVVGGYYEAACVVAMDADKQRIRVEMRTIGQVGNNPLCKF